jgi:hypothetical protein
MNIVTCGPDAALLIGQGQFTLCKSCGEMDMIHDVRQMQCLMGC